MPKPESGGVCARLATKSDVASAALEFADRRVGDFALPHAVHRAKFFLYVASCYFSGTNWPGTSSGAIQNS